MDWFPVYLSLKIATYATIFVILIGIPLGWLLARGKFKGKSILSAMVTLPLVLPPTVLGYYLLVFMGRQGPLGRFLEGVFGVNIIFTWHAAVIASAIVALPLMVRTVQGSMEALDQDIEDVARTLGKSQLQIFFLVTLPLAKQGIIAGTVLAFARAMGEFGATLMVAGNIPGKTQTLPIAIYDAVQGGNYQQANLLVILISVVSVVALLSLNKASNIKRW